MTSRNKLPDEVIININMLSPLVSNMILTEKDCVFVDIKQNRTSRRPNTELRQKNSQLDNFRGCRSTIFRVIAGIGNNGLFFSTPRNKVTFQENGVTVRGMESL